MTIGGLIFTMLTLGLMFFMVMSIHGRRKSPVVTAIALLGIVLVAVWRISVAPDLLTGFSLATIDIAIGLLASSAYLARKKRPAGPFLALTLLAFILGGALMGLNWLSRAFGTSAPGVSAKQTEFLLELGPDDSIDEVNGILTRFDATWARAFPNVDLEMDEDLAQYYLVSFGSGQRDALSSALMADSENVDSFLPNLPISIPQPIVYEGPLSDEKVSAIASDPLISEQWHIRTEEVSATHELLSAITPSRKAIVAILDTGVDEGHEDISDVLGPGSGGKDINGHGTHCAGIAGAATNNAVGVASLNWDGRFVEIRNYKVFADFGGASAELVAQGIIDATRDGADVISMSLGSWAPIPPKVEVDAIEFAQSRGVIVLAAAGNDNEDAAEHAPSNIEGVISVAALDEAGEKASFSNTNLSLTHPVSAPGVGILSLKSGGGYVKLNGTSMATPFVAGLIGVMRSIDNSITGEQAYDILKGTGLDMTTKSLGPAVRPLDAIRQVIESSTPS